MVRSHNEGRCQRCFIHRPRHRRWCGLCSRRIRPGCWPEQCLMIDAWEVGDGRPSVCRDCWPAYGPAPVSRDFLELWRIVSARGFVSLKYKESSRLRSHLQSHAVGLFVHDVMLSMSAHVLPCLLFDRRSHVICFCNVMHVLLHSRSSVREKEDRCSIISLVGRLNHGVGAETYSVQVLL